MKKWDWFGVAGFIVVVALVLVFIGSMDIVGDKSLFDLIMGR